MHLYYSADYVRAGYAFDTTRKASWIASCLHDHPIAPIRLIAPEPLTQEYVSKVHEPAYVAAIRTGSPRGLAESQGFTWDEQLWPAVMASNGGVVAAATAALTEGVSGSLSSGLHHARRAHGAGFCTFNGLVLASRAAVESGAERILILDLDAHCGGGTHSLVGGDAHIWQMDVAVNPFDAYRPGARVTLDVVPHATTYLEVIEARLAALRATGPRFDLCLYNAGMDPYEECSIGGLPGITYDLLARREEMVFAWCRAQALPVAFVLAGGYVGPGLPQQDLVALHRLTVAAATRT